MMSRKKFLHYRTCVCGRCGEKIRVWTYQGRVLYARECPWALYDYSVRDPWFEMRLVYDGRLGFIYFANVCPYCNAIQDDWDLYCKPGGALRKFWDGGVFVGAVDNVPAIESPGKST